MLHAVVVGVDRYQDPSIQDLSCARGDAEAVAKLLERIHPHEREVELLLDENATKYNVMEAIGKRVAERARGPKDVVLLYFACHGSPELAADPDFASRYLVLHDTRYDSLYTSGIDVEHELTHWFTRIHGPTLVLSLIDACFSGRAGGRTFEGPNLRRKRAEYRAEAISLRDIELGEGRIIMSACDDDQKAFEDERLGHGLFTHYLLQRPASADPALPSIGVLSWYEEVARAVRQHTAGRQVPVLNGRSALAELPYLW
jgi:uncharacterized caspase-like protein